MTEITDQIPHENKELLHIPIDQCIISDYDNLPRIFRGNINIDVPEPKELHKTFAKPFIYYQHAEDEDHYNKIQDLFELQHEPDNEKVVNCYTDDDAESQYLTRNPVSFLIVGKPEIGQTHLAQLLSQHWKCMYISPESVLREEIESDSRPGKCIKYNLENGRSVGPEIILRLVEKRVRSQSAQHRGYVLSGFPLLKNEFFKEDPISSESAVFNVQEIFEDLIPAKPMPAKPGSVSLVRDGASSVISTKEGTREETKEGTKEGTREGTIEGTKEGTREGTKEGTREGTKSKVEFDDDTKSIQKKSEIRLSKDMDIGPSDMTIVAHTESFHCLSDSQEQLKFIKSLLGQPLIIIYVMSGAIDVRNKREKYRYNIELEQEVLNPPDTYDEIESNPEDFLFPWSKYQIDGNTAKVHIKLPMHFRSCISTQLWQYKCHVHSILKGIILEHNPEYFIKLDGRLSPEKMFDCIVNRLHMLSFHPVLLPRKLSDEEETYGEIRGPTEAPKIPTDITSLSPEEAFPLLRQKMIVGPMYKFQLSNWAYKCPVSLKDGRCVDGKTDFAVQYMNKIFFLSSEDALLKFYRNPRPYLLPVLPSPTCRIWVMGPKCSGKSVVARCLAILLNCKILNPADLELGYMKRKEADFIDKLKIAAITKRLSELDELRKKEREDKINTWKEESKLILEKAIALIKSGVRICSIRGSKIGSSKSVRIDSISSSQRGEGSVRIGSVSTEREGSARIDSKTNQRGEGSVRIDSKSTQRGEGSVRIDSKSFQRGEGSARIDSKLTQRGEASARIDSKSIQRGEGSVRIDSKLTQRGEGSATIDSKSSQRGEGDHPQQQEETQQNIEDIQQNIEDTQQNIEDTQQQMEETEQLLEEGEPEETDVQDSEADSVKHQLLSFNLPCTTDVDQMEILCTNSEELLQHLPEELKIPIEPATVFDSFVYDYVEQVGQTASIPDMSLSIEEKVEMFKTEIDQAEEEYRFLYKRLGGWIIDGMTTDMEILEKLAPHYLADDVIYLQDESTEHTFLREKFTNKEFDSWIDVNEVFMRLKKDSIIQPQYKMRSYSSAANFIKSLVDDIQDRVIVTVDDDVTEEELQDERNKEYEDSIEEFLLSWSSVKDFLQIYNISPMELSIDKISTMDMLVQIITNLENRYRKTASFFTDAERAQEMKDFAEPYETGEGMYGEGATDDSALDFFRRNRRLGRTNMYCPVVFDRYFVLWKGKDEFAVKFEQQIYFLSSESAMNEFVENPRLFLTDTPPREMPPARICLTGTQRGGKSSLGQKLAENFGLCYVHYDSLILSILNLPSHNDFEDIFRLDPSLNSSLSINLEEIQQVKRYIENGEKFENNITKKLLTPLWFEEPYQTVGFVLDGFPRRASDVEIMIENLLIPDVVIEINVNQDDYITRLLPLKMELYRGEIMEKKRLKDLENEKIYNAWYELRLERQNVLLEEKREIRRLQFIEEKLANKKLLPTPVQSGIAMGEDMPEEEAVVEDTTWFVYDELMESEDNAEVNKLLDEEMPEPKFDDVWEAEDETQIRVMGYLNADYPKDLENLDTVREALRAENIECTLIQSDVFVPNEELTLDDKYLYEMIRLVDPLKFRNLSVFERVYEINLDVAEKLIQQGYYFLSKFGRTCPVQVYEKYNPIQMYFPGLAANTLYPVIHKLYIYFIHGEESLKKFKNDPLTYVLNKEYKFPLMPFRIAVIGPPKSGKTTLVNRFSKEFDMKIISRGAAIRGLQKTLPNADLTKNINQILNAGWSVTLDQTARAVEAMTMHSQSLSQGYIMDGFPNTQQEMTHLKYIGIVPHIILDIQTSMIKIKEYCEIPVKRDPFPNYSFQMITHLCDQWQKNAAYFRSVMFEEYSDIYPIENLDSKWRLWDQAKQICFTVLKEFQNYLISKEYDNVLSVRYLSVTPKEFFALQSVFMNYCPLCYYYDEYLVQSSNYPERNCVFQYLGEYFYICEEHHNQFIKNAAMYLPPVNEKLLPLDLPKRIIGQLNDKSYQNGLCIVCFWNNQPKYVLLQGDPQFAVMYKGVQYLFCCEECLKTFMRNPVPYYNKIIHFQNPKPIEIGELNKLPTLGYFEQLSARILIDAVMHVEIYRPYFVGLGISKSAAIQIAMFLKRHNPKANKLTLELYNEAQEKLKERRQKFTRYLAYFKGRLNPFIDWKPRHMLPTRPGTELVLDLMDIYKWMEGRMGESKSDIRNG